MEVSTVTLWLIAGAILVAVEVFVMPTMILAFAGFGAITAGLALNFGMVETIPNQVAVFFFGTIVWALILWIPLKGWYGPEGGGYEDMIGHTAIVGENGLQKGIKGEVVWSGSIWNARLSPDSPVDNVEGGREVVILKVETGVLSVALPDK
ncbi:MAG: hypothetical protein OEZ32_05880 [Nitrospinota bacterium]|nr:hypothetical protein [Nitrospinota bacterium]